MAMGAAEVLGERLLDGLVISKPGHLDHEMLTAQGLQGIEADHPVPGMRSLQAGERLLGFLAGLPAGRPLLFLISGGTSSLLEVPREGVDLATLQRVNRWLLGSGLPIQSMNRVRRALSAIKGGGLLTYIGRRPVLALMISDVQGDDPAVIGSGLLFPDGESEDELAGIDFPDWLRPLLASGRRPLAGGTQVEGHILATLRDAREAAAAAARQLGYQTRVSHAFISAEAETVGRRLALELHDALPGVYVWGGEPVVRLPARPGRGGRCQQLALAAATVISGRDDLVFLAAGTDGGDGPGADAGALVDGATLGRARRQGYDPRDCLDRADAGTLLAATGDLIQTGPTGSNVMDLMIGLRSGK